MTSGSRRQALRLIETSRTVFYTPIYVSIAGGFLESEGLDVTFNTCPPEFSHPHSALNRDGADIAQSGIMRGIISSDWGAETVPAHFAKINARDGFFILGRQRQEEFQWTELRGARVIPMGMSMPWASFQYALRNNGVSPSELELVSGLTLYQAVDAFRQGQADFVHLPQPAAEQLIDAGVAHLTVALGPVNGDLAYSSFVATNKFITARPDVVQRFVDGYAQALKWLAASDAVTVGDAVAPFFPGVTKELIIKAVDRYRAQDTWPTDPMLREPEYERLQDILVAAGLVMERQPYLKIVRTDFAQAVTS